MSSNYITPKKNRQFVFQHTASYNITRYMVCKPPISADSIKKTLNFGSVKIEDIKDNTPGSSKRKRVITMDYEGNEAPNMEEEEEDREFKKLKRCFFLRLEEEYETLINSLYGGGCNKLRLEFLKKTGEDAKRLSNYNLEVLIMKNKRHNRLFKQMNTLLKQEQNRRDKLDYNEDWDGETEEYVNNPKNDVY